MAAYKRMQLCKIGPLCASQLSQVTMPGSCKLKSYANSCLTGWNSGPSWPPERCKTSFWPSRATVKADPYVSIDAKWWLFHKWPSYKHQVTKPRKIKPATYIPKGFGCPPLGLLELICPLAESLWRAPLWWRTTALTYLHWAVGKTEFKHLKSLSFFEATPDNKQSEAKYKAGLFKSELRQLFGRFRGGGES